jgi:hypothetical protein
MSIICPMRRCKAQWRLTLTTDLEESRGSGARSCARQAGSRQWSETGRISACTALARCRSRGGENELMMQLEGVESDDAKAVVASVGTALK